MRRTIAKRLINEARNLARDGSVIINREYDRLKKEHKKHTEEPKVKTSKRQLRLSLINKMKEQIRKDEYKMLVKLNTQNRNPKRRPKQNHFRKV